MRPPQFGTTGFPQSLGGLFCQLEGDSFSACYWVIRGAQSQRARGVLRSDLRTQRPAPTVEAPTLRLLLSPPGTRLRLLLRPPARTSGVVVRPTSRPVKQEPKQVIKRIGAGSGIRTRTGLTTQRILSPHCLPVPTSRHLQNHTLHSRK